MTPWMKKLIRGDGATRGRAKDPSVECLECGREIREGRCPKCQPVEQERAA